MIATASPPASPPAARRVLADGSVVELTSTPTGLGLYLHDATGGDAYAALTAAEVRQLGADLQRSTGGTPAPRAAVLAGSIRRTFELLAELERVDPAGAALLYGSIASHLRSCQPLALAGGVL